MGAAEARLAREMLAVTERQRDRVAALRDGSRIYKRRMIASTIGYFACLAVCVFVWRPFGYVSFVFIAAQIVAWWRWRKVLDPIIEDARRVSQDSTLTLDPAAAEKRDPK